MATYQQSTDVNAGADALFAYLSDVSNLPKYFDRMTSAQPAEGEAVHTTANLNGQEFEGEAWFRVDDGGKTISWGSEGPSNYSGELEVSGEGGSSKVDVRLNTERVESDEINDGLRTSLANIKRLVEAS